MGTFPRKYGKCTGSEAWALVYPSATSFGLSALLLLVCPNCPPLSRGAAAEQVNAGADQTQSNRLSLQTSTLKVDNKTP